MSAAGTLTAEPRDREATSHDARPRRWLSVLSWAIPLALVLSLIASCVIESGRRYFWTDEIFSLRVLTMPELSSMLRALAGGADGAPPLYYVLGWAWVRAFGASELSLRLLSSAGFCTAVLLLWPAVRRAFGTRAAAIGLLTTFGSSQLVLYQNAEARFYGLLTALCALATTLTASIAVARRPGKALLAATVLTNAALVLSHVYGFVYGGVLLASLVAWDLWDGRIRPTCYGAYLAGWLAFIPWLRPFAVQRDLTLPGTWTPVPSIGDLLKVFLLDIHLLALAILVVVFLAQLRRRGAAGQALARDAVAPTRAAPPEASALLLASAALLAVPVASFAMSRVSTSVFWPRYFVPSVTAWAIVLAWLARSLEPAGTAAVAGLAGVMWRGGWRRWVPGAMAMIGYPALCLLAAAYPVYWAMSSEWMEHPGKELRKVGLAGLPVAIESPHAYLPLTRYPAFPGQRYYFILDSLSAFDPRSSRGATVDFKLMRAQHRYLDTMGVVSGARFLCTYDRFLAIDSSGRLWFDDNVEASAAYRTELVGSHPWGAIMLVQRVSGARPACPSGRGAQASLRPTVMMKGPMMRATRLHSRNASTRL